MNREQKDLLARALDELEGFRDWLNSAPLDELEAIERALGENAPVFAVDRAIDAIWGAIGVNFNAHLKAIDTMPEDQLRKRCRKLILGIADAERDRKGSGKAPDGDDYKGLRDNVFDAFVRP